MASIQLRKRHRLKKKEIRRIAEELLDVLGVETFSDGDTVDMAESRDYDVVFVNNSILAFIMGDEAFLTVRGLLRYAPRKRFVTVDMGAIKFVYNGADVMSPGIVDADREIRPGDLVWVRDEKNGQPLAVGRALVSGEKMVANREGKAVKSIINVGDNLWKLEEN